VASTQAPASKKPPKPAAAPTQSAANTNNTNTTAAATTSNPDAAAADADSGTPASPPGSRFAVQLGSFPDDASAKAWASKLKAAGVPAYTEHRKQADGTSRTLLRAGPFADRAAASAAIAKVREAGLTSGSNNGSAQ
jgi:DedD protein